MNTKMPRHFLDLELVLCERKWTLEIFCMAAPAPTRYTARLVLRPGGGLAPPEREGGIFAVSAVSLVEAVNQLALMVSQRRERGA